MASLFEANLAGVRVLRWCNWLRTRDASVVYMPVSY
jgi:hypothetical protein